MGRRAYRAGQPLFANMTVRGRYRCAPWPPERRRPPTGLPRRPARALSRQEVAASQRGPACCWRWRKRSPRTATSIRPSAEVLRRAGVSRETFYEHFANKEECFLASYDAGASVLLEAMREGPRPARRDEVRPRQSVLDRPSSRANFRRASSRDPAGSPGRSSSRSTRGGRRRPWPGRVEVQRRFVVDALVDVGRAARTKEQAFRLPEALGRRRQRIGDAKRGLRGDAPNR